MAKNRGLFVGAEDGVGCLVQTSTHRLIQFTHKPASRMLPISALPPNDFVVYRPLLDAEAGALPNPGRSAIATTIIRQPFNPVPTTMCFSSTPFTTGGSEISHPYWPP